MMKPITQEQREQIHRTPGALILKEDIYTIVTLEQTRDGKTSKINYYRTQLNGEDGTIGFRKKINEDYEDVLRRLVK